MLRGLSLRHTTTADLAFSARTDTGWPKSTLKKSTSSLERHCLWANVVKKSLQENNNEDFRQYCKQNGEVLFQLGSRQWCHKHKTYCFVRHLPLHVPGLHTKRLRSSGGGVTCTGWCSPGLQKRFSDPSEPHHDIFIAERRQEAISETEEWSWVECSGRKLYPIDVKVAQPLAKTHFVKWVYVGPQHIGFPVGRERCFGFLGAHFNLRWVGPDTF